MFTPNLSPKYGNIIKYEIINHISNILFKNNSIDFNLKRENNSQLPLEVVYYYGLTMLSQNMPHINKIEDLDLTSIPIADDITLDGISLHNLKLTKKSKQKKRVYTVDETAEYDDPLQEYYIYDGTQNEDFTEDYRFNKYNDAGIEFDPLEVINMEALDNERDYYEDLHESYLESKKIEEEEKEQLKKIYDPRYEKEPQKKYRKRRKELLSTLEDFKERIVDNKGNVNSKYLTRLLRNNFNHISWYPDEGNIHCIYKQKDGKSITITYNLISFSEIVIKYFEQMSLKIYYKSKKLHTMEDRFLEKSIENDVDDFEDDYYGNLAYRYRIKREKLMNDIQELAYYLFSIKNILEDYSEDYRENPSFYCDADEKYYGIQREEMDKMVDDIDTIVDTLEDIQFNSIIELTNPEVFEKNGVKSDEKVLLNILFVQESIEDIINIVDYSKMKIYSFDQSKNIASYREKLEKKCVELTNLLTKDKKYNQMKEAYKNKHVTKEKFEEIQFAREKRINKIIEELNELEAKYKYYKYDGEDTTFDKYSITNHIRNANAHGNIYISDDYNQIVTIIDINPETGMLVFYATIPLLELLKPFYRKNVLEDLFDMNNVVNDIKPDEVSTISK